MRFCHVPSQVAASYEWHGPSLAHQYTHIAQTITLTHAKPTHDTNADTDTDHVTGTTTDRGVCVTLLLMSTAQNKAWRDHAHHGMVRLPVKLEVLSNRIGDKVKVVPRGIRNLQRLMHNVGRVPTRVLVALLSWQSVSLCHLFHS
jgi:hypothetical protein